MNQTIYDGEIKSSRFQKDLYRLADGIQQLHTNIAGDGGEAEIGE